MVLTLRFTEWRNATPDLLVDVAVSILLKRNAMFLLSWGRNNKKFQRVRGLDCRHEV